MGPLALAAGLLLSTFFAPGAQAQSALECVSPQTQQLMNACAARDYDMSDIALNAAWGPAKSYADSIKQGAALLKAQRAWLAYRDAACEVQASPYQGGSIQPLIHLVCLSELTEQRTAMLNEFRSN
ncbi:lysozyme inhibitor LprI family protein [Sulfitobacter sp. SK012]|uniref:lysozyme inhibitor LprI family protein n=1 Tax=Sulfitobacter sp. SK012 TaxID=1389005 RepID=UPI001575C22F|nr:lysozyme inhibitor LprI family protein [Sulfitobacter sp. SK012]